jgi:hypothetical protein
MSRKVLLLSEGVLRNPATGGFYPGILEALKMMRQGNHILLVSNHGRPTWLTSDMAYIQYYGTASRQSGDLVENIISDNKSKNIVKSEIIVIGAADADMQMASNSNTLLIRPAWAKLEANMAKYGVEWKDPSTLPALVDYLDDTGPWFFVSPDTFLNIYCLTSAGTKYETDADYEKLANRMRWCLKDGQVELKSGLTLHLLSSIYATSGFSEAKRWGFYPSSNSANDLSEVMAEFTRHAGHLFKRRVKEPLFIRHKPSVKRHLAGGNRTDATSQVTTLHLNPYYKGKLKGEMVVVLDDFLTYGLSFGVAAAFLKKAGAKKVIGIAMGKFGGVAQRYQIEIEGDPFSPAHTFQQGSSIALTGTSDKTVKLKVVKKFKSRI